MGGKDDDTSNEFWPWNDKTFRRMQAEHEKFMKDFENQSRSLREDVDEITTPSSANSPFAAFKQFVDSNFNAVSDHFRNLPSNIADIKARMEKMQEQRQQEELEISRRWTGSEDSPDHIRMELSRTTEQEKDEVHSATVQLLSESYERNQHVPVERIQNLFKDPEGDLGVLDRLAGPMLALGGAWFFTPETGDKLPTPSDWRWPAPGPRWLSVKWFKRSPYSPIRLEAHEDLGRSGEKWRAAFEDLLDATLDKPMKSSERQGYRPPYGEEQSTYYGPGLDWMLSLQCRGILPPLLPKFWSNFQAKDDVEPLKSLLNQFPWSSRSIPWTSEPSFRSCSSLHQEVSELMSEIGVKSTPRGQSCMLTKQQQVELVCLNKSRWASAEDTSEDTSEDGPRPFAELESAETSTSPISGQPETELDLYNSPYFQHQDSSSPLGDEPPKLRSHAFTGPRRQEEGKALTLMEYFVETNDIGAICNLLNDWYRSVGNVELLANVVTGDALPLVVKALRCSDLPEDDFWKRESHCVNSDELLREALRLTSGETKSYDEFDRLCDQWGNGQLDSHEPIQRIEKRRPLQEETRTSVDMNDDNIPSLRKPDVLSALTTTNVSRLPDGTVTTKVVLKQRFADGREETTESVHTTKEDIEHQQDKPQKSKGWFWS